MLCFNKTQNLMLSGRTDSKLDALNEFQFKTLSVLIIFIKSLFFDLFFPFSLNDIFCSHEIKQIVAQIRNENTFFWTLA